MPFGLPEEIVLLGLDDTTGKCISSYTQYSWTAGVLAELAVQRRIAFTNGAPVEVLDASPTGDDLLDEVLRSLQAHPRRLASALRANLAAHGRDRTLARLVESGILEYHDNRILGLFHVRRYPAHGGAAESQIRERLRASVVDGVEPDERTRALLGIAAGAGLTRAFLTRDERTATKPRLTEILQDEAVGRTLRRVIEEDEAAATTATIIAATT